MFANGVSNRPTFQTLAIEVRPLECRVREYAMPMTALRMFIRRHGVGNPSANLKSNKIRTLHLHWRVRRVSS
jgi:hypothetical protein